MTALKLTAYLGAILLFYSYIGYGLLLYLLVKLKAFLNRKKHLAANKNLLQPVTLIVAAYNEADFIREKIRNTLALDYPDNLLQIIFITDGSTDDTPAIVGAVPRIRLLHQPERAGKVAAMHRAMQQVTTPFVIFSDANTLLNKAAVKNIMRHYANEQVGGVAGEKKVFAAGQKDAAGASEGLYWKYESWLKMLDWKLYSVVGAAGELFSIRTALYQYQGSDILLDDFVISLKVCQKGYRVAYEPEAYASESASVSFAEEQKRKVRIGAGAFQSIVLLRALLNPFRYGKLSFQYISHRVLRWTLCPLLMPIVLIAATCLLIRQPTTLHLLLAGTQYLFYLLAAAGWIAIRRNVHIKLLYAPFYFVFINYTLYLGFLRFLKGNQSVLWDKAARSDFRHHAALQDAAASTSQTALQP
jgi:biofilm PGA synthesis N-glycosyltransferase PgaC